MASARHAPAHRVLTSRRCGDAEDRKAGESFLRLRALHLRGAAGAFASTDLFFYAFHELALIPTFLLIGMWGTGERYTAAWKITIYLGVGSIVLLIGLVDLYLAVPEGSRTFSLIELQRLAENGLIPAAAQSRPYIFLLIGFGILISLFPFHSWAPPAYASAPTPVVMLHAGVLKNSAFTASTGRRTAAAARGQVKAWANLLLILLVGNIIYIGLVTIAEEARSASAIRA